MPARPAEKALAAPPGLPVIPSDLSKDPREQWRRIVPLLVELGLRVTGCRDGEKKHPAFQMYRGTPAMLAPLACGEHQ